MKNISSYGCRILQPDGKLMKYTVWVYRDAVSFLIDCFEKEFATLSLLTGKDQEHAAEKLVHATKKNPFPRYADFDFHYKKMPSYLRRSAIAAALGAVKSYHSQMDLWVKNGCKGRAPKLTVDRFVMPAFYRDNMFRPGSKPDTALLKLYNGYDWVWAEVRLRHTDMEYIRRHWTGKHECAPVLEKRHHSWHLRFAFEEEVPLSKTPVDDQVICAVDLGLNTDAVCVIMRSDGTVLGREFIDYPSEKDQLWRVLNRIRKQQRKNGPRSTKSAWRYARNLNSILAHAIARSIVEYTASWNCDCIVFEHLDVRGKKARGGSKRQKLHMWRKSDIQRIAEHQAHRRGMRISRICPWKTSALAFDGSGPLTRDEHNKALAVFSTGKQYNADLSAAQNIGARYFIRERLKPCTERCRCLYLAKVPDAGRRIYCTLATLRQLDAAMKEPA